MAQSFRDLEVWQLSMDLAVLVDDLVDTFKREGTDLRWQMRRSSMSIPFNVAEGYRRRSDASYLNHVSIAMGSQGELETQLEFTVRSRRLTRQQVTAAEGLNKRVGWMLFRLWESLGGHDHNQKTTA